ncbi:hypothetical protein ACIXMO_06025 [Bacteroides fragilis]|nr:hypothetical protein [Bacteroides fragilis]
MVSARVITIMTDNGDRVFACLDYRIRICMFFMFLSFYRRLSDCLVRAEGTP